MNLLLHLFNFKYEVFIIDIESQSMYEMKSILDLDIHTCDEYREGKE